jgi:DNA-binding NtrC family response regulator
VTSIFGAPASLGHPPRVLVIEDEQLISMSIEDMVRSLGYQVSGTAYNIAAARRELAKRNFEAVLLDIKIQDQVCTDIADVLSEMVVPFAFITGYSHAPEPRFERVPLLYKPFTAGQLGNVLEKLLGARGVHAARWPTGG